MPFGQDGQFRNREAIEVLEQAGVSRVTIWLSNTEGTEAEALAAMEEIARQLLANQDTLSRKVLAFWHNTRSSR